MNEEKYIEESEQINPNKEIWNKIHSDLKTKIEKQNLEIVYDNKYERQLEEIKSKCYANLENTDLGYSFWDKLFLLIEFLKTASKIIINIVVQTLSIYIRIKNMGDPKTTWTGIIGALCIIIQTVFQFNIPIEVQGGFVALIVFLIGLFSKDSTKPITK